MTELERVILIALGLLAAVCLIVSLTLRHYIGGFLAAVAQEEEASEENEAADGAGVPPAGQEKKT